MHDEGQTRPILLIDEEHRLAHVFAVTSKLHPGQVVRRKTADLDDPVFAPGLGEPLILSLATRTLNDPSSTKQNVNRETGILVIASDAETRCYFHNFLSLEPVAAIDDVQVTHREEAERHFWSARVVLRDGLRSVLDDVTVTAQWSGALSATDTVRTDGQGVAVFPEVETENGEPVTFCVVNVARGDQAYARTDGESCATATVPGPPPGSGAIRLLENRPNPFRQSTTIRLSLARRERVDLTIYDVAGREVRTLVKRALPAGEHQYAWDGRDARGEPASAGIYLYRLKTEDGTRVKKMSLLR
jgi:hypothetical protein